MQLILISVVPPTAEPDDVSESTDAGTWVPDVKLVSWLEECQVDHTTIQRVS